MYTKPLKIGDKLLFRIRSDIDLEIVKMDIDSYKLSVIHIYSKEKGVIAEDVNKCITVQVADKLLSKMQIR